MDRWKEQYSDLCHARPSSEESTLAEMEQPDILHELDEMPTISELSKTIDQLALGKPEVVTTSNNQIV